MIQNQRRVWSMCSMFLLRRFLVDKSVATKYDATFLPQRKRSTSKRVMHQYPLCILNASQQNNWKQFCPRNWTITHKCRLQRSMPTLDQSIALWMITVVRKWKQPITSDNWRNKAVSNCRALTVVIRFRYPKREIQLPKNDLAAETDEITSSGQSVHLLITAEARKAD